MRAADRNRVARFYDVGDLRIETEALPAPGPGEALVRTRVCGICSGDVMAWYLRRKAPLVFGHEVAGVVQEVGPGVTRFRPGDRVFVHHHAPCLRCRLCRRGEHVQCPEWRASRLVPGGMADYFLVPRNNLERDTLALPDHVDWEAAALIEPTACVIKSLRRSQLKPGERVFVVGLGIMGQLHVVLARRLGAREVFASDFVAWRRERAIELGADEAYDPAVDDPVDRLDRRTGGELADVVIVGPGSSEAIRAGVRLAGRAGRVILFTATPPEERTELPLHDLYFREIRLLPSYSCGPRETREALRRIAAREIPVNRLVTHRFPLEEVASAYRVAANPDLSLKTLVTFPDT